MNRTNELAVTVAKSFNLPDSEKAAFLHNTKIINIVISAATSLNFPKFEQNYYKLLFRLLLFFFFFGANLVLGFLQISFIQLLSSSHSCNQIQLNTN